MNVYFVGGWGNSSSSNSKAAQSAKVLLLLQILSISLIQLEVSALVKKVFKDPILKLVTVLVKAVTYSAPLWLTALSIFLSLQIVSGGPDDYSPSPGKLTLISEANEYVLSIDFDLFFIIEMLLLACGDVEANPGPFSCETAT